MKELNEVMVLGVTINSNFLGGYFLEITDEKMKSLFTLPSVKDYADYVRVNRNMIEATVWFVKDEVDQNIIDKVYKEVSLYPDLFLIQNDER